MAGFSASVLNMLVAPTFSEFKSADIPDLRSQFDQADHWVANYLLSTVFRARFRPGVHEVALGFLRRAHQGFKAYHDARAKTEAFVQARARGEQPLVLYFEAIADWETFLLQLQIANDLFRCLAAGQLAFQPNDGSPEQRLYDSANVVKHSGEKFMNTPSDPVNSLPLWVLGEGLHAHGGIVVSFGEAARVLGDISRLADALQDPKGFGDRIAG